MTYLSEQAQNVTDKIIDDDLDQLYARLGMSLRAISLKPEAAGQFESTVDFDVEALGPFDTLRDFGLNYLLKVEGQVHRLICNPDDKQDRDELARAFGLGREAVAGAIGALLISSLGIAPPVAVVLAPVVVKVFFEPAQKAMCEQWNKRLEALKA